jgi:hypothetical protein
MSSSRTDRWARGVGLLSAFLLVTACAATPDAEPGQTLPSRTATASATPGPTATTAATLATDSVPAREELTDAILRTLGARSAAVSAHDLQVFLAGLDHSDATFVARQRSYFDAFGRLPAGSTLALTVRPGSIRPDGAGYLATVNADTQIAGFDALPVAGRRLFRFTPDRARPGELLIADDSGGFLEPWESISVVLRRSHGVLGVFDEGSVAVADPVMRSAKAALADVGTAVPYDWSRTVVVYALSSPDFLAGLGDVPGGDPLALDAVSFPVRSGDGRLAATRIALHPRTLADGPESAGSRDRLLRHEMVHVAVGEHDDRAPLWLSEGVAEYLSVRSLAPEDRTLSRAAVRAARAGLRALPADDAFTGPAHEASYGVSWWACEALVASYGELALWQLFDAYAAAPAGAGSELADTLGIDEAALAAKAGRLMLAHYGGG